MTIQLTTELRKEIYQSIVKFTKLITKENLISEDLRYHDKIALWESKVNDLHKMLEVGYIF
jgi:hypothetical protein